MVHTFRQNEYFYLKVNRFIFSQNQFVYLKINLRYSEKLNLSNMACLNRAERKHIFLILREIESKTISFPEMIVKLIRSKIEIYDLAGGPSTLFLGSFTIISFHTRFSLFFTRNQVNRWYCLSFRDRLPGFKSPLYHFL